MEPTVPNPRPGWQPCPLPWCDSTHNPDPDVEHTRQIADLDLDRHTVEVIYCQPQKAGHLKDPLIRVTWGADFAPYGVLDIPVHAAEALGSIFELLTVQTYMEFGAALARGAKGPRPGSAGAVVIRFVTTVAVVLLAAVAAIVSYQHAYEVVTANGESGLTAYLVPLTIDGAIFASSMVLLDAARRGLPVPALARWTLALGILATLAANVATGWAHGPVGSIVAAWPAVALVLSYELLMGMIRRGAVPAVVPLEVAVLDEVERAWRDVEELLKMTEASEVHMPAVPVQVTGVASPGDPRGSALAPVDGAEGEVQPEGVPDPDADLYPLALSHFLGDVTMGKVPPVRTIKTRMSVGTDRARKLQAYLGQLVAVAT